jgi:hypothetical protein
MVRLGSLSSQALKAMDGLEIHGTDVSGPLITDAPPLTFHQPYDCIFRELAAGHQGALPFRELPAACHTTQPFDVLVRPCPRPMRDVACTGTMALGTWWIRARESGISLLRWRRQCHNGPPVVRNGRKDPGWTPASPRDYSPGLPILDFGHFSRNQIAGKWQPHKGFIEGGKEARELRDVCLPTRLHLISAEHRSALA